jgi:hypothetical protein
VTFLFPSFGKLIQIIEVSSINELFDVHKFKLMITSNCINKWEMILRTPSAKKAIRVIREFSASAAKRPSAEISPTKQEWLGGWPARLLEVCCPSSYHSCSCSQTSTWEPSRSYIQ